MKVQRYMKPESANEMMEVILFCETEF